MSSLLVFQRWAKLSDEQRERVAIPLLTRIRFCEKQNIADITSIIFEMIADIQNDKLVDVNNDTVTTV